MTRRHYFGPVGYVLRREFSAAVIELINQPIEERHAWLSNLLRTLENQAKLAWHKERVWQFARYLIRYGHGDLLFAFIERKRDPEARKHWVHGLVLWCAHAGELTSLQMIKRQAALAAMMETAGDFAKPLKYAANTRVREFLSAWRDSPRYPSTAGIIVDEVLSTGEPSDFEDVSDEDE